MRGRHDDRGMVLEIAAKLPRPLAFVLGGGGSWGALQLGMLQALAQTDLRPDLVVGTSVGSLNGCILAADPANAEQRLAALWPQITRDDVFPRGWIRSFRTLHASRAWIYDNAPLTDLITAQIPVGTFEELAVPLVAVATDFATGARVDLDSGDLRSALLASSAIPGIFPPVQREDRRLVDGGLIANVSIGTALDRGARSIVVLDCGLPGVTAKAAGSFLEVLVQSVAIMGASSNASQLERCGDVPVVWLDRGAPNTRQMLDFSETAQMIAQARAHSLTTLTAVAALPDLPAGLYSRGLTPPTPAHVVRRLG